jgi:hypothetical protein
MLAEAVPPVWLNEMLDFLAGGPTPEQIIAFKLSPATQARLEELLDKNREAELANEETAELRDSHVQKGVRLAQVTVFILQGRLPLIRFTRASCER